MDKTILVVEDDATLRETVAYNLRSEGYAVVVASDGIAALDALRQQSVSLVLLDLMLPRMDGLEVCRRIRSRPETAQTPILMLTARGDETDKVVGLEMGADDYVTKPFSWQELRARIRALLRRGEQTQEYGPTPPETGDGGVLMAGGLHIDTMRHEVTREGQEIELPARLFDLLVYMVRNRGLVVTRDRVLQQVWGYDYAGDTRTIDVHVRWLREKIEQDPANPRLIVTVRGVGYRFKG
jgi:two-component system alkaline phosphatase synthesis response regulator PhoP